MSGWTFDQATVSYSLKVEGGTYFVAQADDGTWRAFFLPDGLGRYRTDGEAMRAVDEYLAGRP